jgi:hypothetical protein
VGPCLGLDATFYVTPRVADTPGVVDKLNATYFVSFHCTGEEKSLGSISKAVSWRDMTYFKLNEVVSI